MITTTTTDTILYSTITIAYSYTTTTTTTTTTTITYATSTVTAASCLGSCGELAGSVGWTLACRLMRKECQTCADCVIGTTTVPSTPAAPVQVAPADPSCKAGCEELSGRVGWGDTCRLMPEECGS